MVLQLHCCEGLGLRGPTQVCVLASCYLRNVSTHELYDTLLPSVDKSEQKEAESFHQPTHSACQRAYRVPSSGTEEGEEGPTGKSGDFMYHNSSQLGSHTPLFPVSHEDIQPHCPHYQETCDELHQHALLCT